MTLSLLIAASLAAPARAELISSVNAFQPGKPFTIGIRLTLDDGYHSYWLNPGDSGFAPTARWKLPKGWKAGPLEFQVPDRITWAGTTVFGYEHGTILLTEITSPPSARSTTLKADLGWMICKDDCIPLDTPLTLHLRVGKKPEPNRTWAKRIDSIRKAKPGPFVGAGSATMSDSTITLTLANHQMADDANLDFFPRETGLADPKGAAVVTKEDGKLIFTMKRQSFSDKKPARLVGLLKVLNQAEPTAYWVDVPMRPSGSSSPR